MFPYRLAKRAKDYPLLGQSLAKGGFNRYTIHYRIDRYKAKYGYVPDDVAALTWDATRIVLQAIQNAGKLSGKLKKDREAVRKGMTEITSFAGITGNMKFDEQGDPVKCAVVVRISDSGESYNFV